MAARARQATRVLEKGDIYFIYRPKVQWEQAQGIEDVQRTYLVLSPYETDLHRLMIVGKKRMPEAGDSRERNWGFIDKVARDPQEVLAEFEPATYETETRGQRIRPAARPVGEGVYALVGHGDHTHFAYELELPQTPGEAQSELNLREEDSLILGVKNPEQKPTSKPGL